MNENTSEAATKPSTRPTGRKNAVPNRASSQPPAKSTRRPSMVWITAGAAKCALATSWSTRPCGWPSAQGTLSSGVEKLEGKALSSTPASGARLTISSKRQPA